MITDNGAAEKIRDKIQWLANCHADGEVQEMAGTMNDLLSVALAASVIDSCEFRSTIDDFLRLRAALEKLESNNEPDQDTKDIDQEGTGTK